jgi:hypothetical protein
MAVIWCSYINFHEIIRSFEGRNIENSNNFFK